MSKTWDGQQWLVNLSWTGGSAPYTIIAGGHPRFDGWVRTLAKGVTGSQMTVSSAELADGLTFINVVGAGEGSRASRGLGYDPEPRPTVTGVSTNQAWWGDTVRVYGQYLDPLPTANSTRMLSQSVRGTATGDVAGDFAGWVDFEIPDDARSFPAMVTSVGRTSLGATAPWVYLAPPRAEPYTGIRGVVFAPQTGRVWVAAQGIVEEVDVFLRDPVVVRTITDFTKPSISRVTSDGRLLVADSVNGVDKVYQIDVNSGAVTEFAQTKDDQFTRNILPGGIAVAPDGSACFIADHNQGRVVRIPAGAGPGSSTINDTWGGRTFSFADPAGMDAVIMEPWIVVVVANQSDGWTHDLYGLHMSQPHEYAGFNIRSIEIDRDSVNTGFVPRFFATAPGMAQVFNHNSVGGAPPRHHGGVLWGLADGSLRLNPNFFFAFHRHFPQPVILSNSGHWAPYPSPHQVSDGVIELLGEGWEGVPVRLRLVDPPDLAAYRPEEGWPDASPAPPYEANDNVPGDPALPAGLSTTPEGPWSEELIVYPAADRFFTAYLRVAGGGTAGNNYQVEMTKCDPSGQPLEQRVVGYSSVYTIWRRVFVERDPMFRRGGVLAEHYGATGHCGGAGQPPCCGESGELPCNQVMAYAWQNAAVDDQVVFFDPTIEATFALGTAGAQHLQRTVVEVSSPDENRSECKFPEDEFCILTLNEPLGLSLRASRSTVVGSFRQPHFGDFNLGWGAGYGVISNCDSRLYGQAINAEGSCYYDADLGGVERSFADAFTELRAVAPGASPLPFIAEEWFQVADQPGYQSWVPNLSRTWNAHRQHYPEKLIHAIGVHKLAGALGYAYPLGLKAAFVARGRVEEYLKEQPPPITPQEAHLATQWITIHEFGHQFSLNECSNTNGHDDRPAWCNDLNHCGCGGQQDKFCVMDDGSSLGEAVDGIMRFCREDLFLGDPNCAPGTVQRRNSSIRTHDPFLQQE